MIKHCFKEEKKLFIPFIMAGFPDKEQSMLALHALEEAGADIIELGVPFSDPIADGPVNQRAAERAIANGIHLVDVLNQVADFRKQGGKTPIILFSYLNPVLALGIHTFCEKAKQAGVDGLLIVDLPPEEGLEFYSIAKQSGLEIILLISPTTEVSRLPLYKSLEPAFIYYISRLAVTGVQQELSASLKEELEHFRRHLPGSHLAVGFGLSTIEQAEEVLKFAEGFVVGSKLVATLEEQGIDAFRRLAFDFASVKSG